MSSNLVQLSYAPGIQRDGTKFQGDFCLDGEWIRFQRGKIKKIGGMKGLNVNTNLAIPSEITLLPYNEGQIYYYIGTGLGIYGGTIDNQFNPTNNGIALTPTYNNPHVQWQAIRIIRNNQPTMAFIATNNATNIAQNTPSRIFYGSIGGAIEELNTTTAGIKPIINGGMCFSSPYLFLYGSNGVVQYSTNNDPLAFTIDNTAELATRAGELPISNDKVIYGKAMRGGPNSPSILFWTLSSVVRIYNAGTKNLDFQKEVISEGSSILSSKCVVEYDGFFYWPGTDRFFVFNGLVLPLINTMSLNYFFDNIDMNYRQKVFGVKVPRFNEIWWFYPEKIDAPQRNPALPAGTNTRVLIYNRDMKSWYDTAISRDCGTFAHEFGFLVTYGRSVTNPTYNDHETFLWRHEYGINEYVPDIAALNNPIISSVTTPIFGWSSFNPIYSGQKTPLIDKWMEIKRIEPDFKMVRPQDEINIVVNTQKYAQSPVVSSEPFIFNGTTEKVDLRVQGRQISFTIRSGADFEVGNITMLVGIGDGQ